MRYNDLQDKCKECEHMKPWSLDMGGNHSCMCKKHQLDYFNKRTDECNEYSRENCKDDREGNAGRLGYTDEEIDVILESVEEANWI